MKLDREEEKKIKKERKKIEKKAEDLLHRLDLLEKEAELLEFEMSLPDNYSDGEKIKKIKAKLDENRKEQENLSLLWENAETELLKL